jgi:signal transduction histidine kinase
MVMRLTPHNDKDASRFIALGVVILVAAISILTAIWFGTTTRSGIGDSLRERSQTIAAALGPQNIAQLKGEEADASTAVYKGLKAQLAQIKAANPDARSIYIMGKNNGQLFFYVDSEQPNSKNYASAGQAYSDGTPQDSAIFDNRLPLVEGPTTDNYGTFVSGLAPIFDPATNNIIAVVGIDVGADTYSRDIIASAALPLLVGMIIVLIIMVFERIRRHNMQLLALRSELVSVASHELRNPITGIRWAAESIQKISADDRVLKMSKAILNSALHLQASTTDILELSHATNGRALNVQQVDMVKLMQEIVETQALSAQQKGTAINFDDYWPKVLNIQCDPDQMRRALHNVLSNAIKYTKPNTNVTISYQQDLKMHKILVADQGIGIPAAEQSKVWRGFYRASNAVRSDIPGTGLGLYLVKTVVERHGGDVSFVSEENKGTTFAVALPKAH